MKKNSINLKKIFLKSVTIVVSVVGFVVLHVYVCMGIIGCIEAVRSTLVMDLYTVCLCQLYTL